VSAHAVLLDAPGLVDQAFENPAYGVGVERLWGLPAQAFEHPSFALGIVDREVVFALELTNGEHDFDALSDELQDAVIQFVDASP
jgi:hypothetical protein